MLGQEEIESLAKLITEYSTKLPPSAHKLIVCPIFASLPTTQQNLAFQPSPKGTRKVVLATNIAETSITIPGIRYVIDTGVAKMRVFNPRVGELISL
jgi:HrpA-like RNA helicase